jgi:hypothetical protein
MALGFALGDTDADAWLMDWNIWIGQVVCRSDMPLEALGGVSGWIDECSKFGEVGGFGPDVVLDVFQTIGPIQGP